MTRYPDTKSHYCIIVWRWRRTANDGKQALTKKRRPDPKTVLRLPDLDQAKSQF
jgi:hypothetical protein